VRNDRLKTILKIRREFGNCFFYRIGWRISWCQVVLFILVILCASFLLAKNVEIYDQVSGLSDILLGVIIVSFSAAQYIILYKTNQKNFICKKQVILGSILSLVVPLLFQYFGILIFCIVFEKYHYISLFKNSLKFNLSILISCSSSAALLAWATRFIESEFNYKNFNFNAKLFIIRLDEYKHTIDILDYRRSDRKITFVSLISSSIKEMIQNIIDNNKYIICKQEELLNKILLDKLYQIKTFLEKYSNSRTRIFKELNDFIVSTTEKCEYSDRLNNAIISKEKLIEIISRGIEWTTIRS